MSAFTVTVIIPAKRIEIIETVVKSLFSFNLFLESSERNTIVKINIDHDGAKMYLNSI